MMSNMFEKVGKFLNPDPEDDSEEMTETEDMEDVHGGRYENPISPNLNKLAKNTQVVMFEPRSFEQAQEIASHLKQQRGCIINLHRLQREYSQRTIDFLSGVVFALDGTIQKVGHNVIFCAPRSVGVEGNITLENAGEE